MKPLHAAPLNPLDAPKRYVEDKIDYKKAPPEMRKAAEGLEAAFTEMMVKGMRDTVEPSEFSLHNHASDIYQGMLDSEYAESSAHANSLGLSKQIVDYWLRSQPHAQYTESRNTVARTRETDLKQEAKGNSNEDQSSK